MGPCLQYLELMNAVLDGEASEAQQAELSTHLSLCSDCTALFHELTAIRAGSDALLTEAPAGFATRVMAATAAASPSKKAGRQQWQWKSLAAMAAVCAVALLGSGSLHYFHSSGEEALPAEASLTAAPYTTQNEIPPSTRQSNDGFVQLIPKDTPTEAVPDANTPAPPSDTAAPMATDNAFVSPRLGTPSPEECLPSSSPRASSKSAPAVIPPSFEASQPGETPPLPSLQINSLLPAVQADTPASQPEPFTARQALELVVVQVYGDSGYTLNTAYLEEGDKVVCQAALLTPAGETVDGTEGVIQYTGLSANEKFYRFTWTPLEDSAEHGQDQPDTAAMEYAVPLDGSYVMWEGDVLDDGASFQAALSE